jgi:menaquinol-cytochrome c reductase iron-sulfur subunit
VRLVDTRDGEPEVGPPAGSSPAFEAGGEPARPEDPEAAPGDPEAGPERETSRPTRPPLLTRRGFVLRALTALGVIAGAIVAVPVAAFMSAPGWLSEAQRRLLSWTVSPTLRSPEWSSAGPLESLELGEPTYLIVERPVVDGWVRRIEPVGVYAVRTGEAEAVVFDRHCTHLGCPVKWASGAGSFLCPCHGGAYDALGEPTAGPPPRALDRYETRVEGGEVLFGDLVKG